MPLTTTVAPSAAMATGGNVAASLGPPGSSFSTDSFKIWRKETIMIMEKTRIPRGSSRRRPTGNLCCKRRIFHWTSLFVVQMIKVQSRSRAESTREAMSEREEDVTAAMILATRRRMLAMTLIYRESVESFTKESAARPYIDSPLSPPLPSLSSLPLILGQQRINVALGRFQHPANLRNTISIGIPWVH